MTHSLKPILLADAQAVAAKAAALFADACRQAVAERDVFHAVLAGGSTPAACYRLLATMDLPWHAIHWYFGDERCLPKGHAERNDVMVEKSLWAHIPVVEQQIHRIRAELGAEAAAADYAQQLAGLPVFDLVLLGMGEDGHTASLFPHNPALDDQRLAVPVFASPKPPATRVTLSYRVLNAARQRLVLIAGAGKRQAWQAVQAGAALPIAGLATSHCLIDRAAYEKQANA